MIVAVLSDIHANLPALEAVLGSLASVDAVWHLGDVVGYGAEPDGVVERLRDAGALGVKGNHDDAAAGGWTLAEFNPTARAAAEWTRNRISPETRRYLDELPARLVLGEVSAAASAAGSGPGPAANAANAANAAPADRFTLAHGSPRDPLLEYLRDRWIAGENLKAFDTPYCLIGHTHIPAAFREVPATNAGSRPARYQMEAVDTDDGARLRLDERRTFINPGSVGQPRDGNPAASYLVLDFGSATATWHRVAYALETAKRRIVEAGLPHQLARRLDVGR
jgi:predicted phosphodiesterase